MPKKFREIIEDSKEVLDESGYLYYHYWFEDEENKGDPNERKDNE